MLKFLAQKIRTYSNYLLILLFILLMISLTRNIFRVLGAGERIERARDRVEKLKKDNEELERKLAEIQSQEFIEKQLRDKLGLAKEGEVVIVLPDEEILRKLAPRQEEEEETLPDPTWRKWLKLFL